jgi:hypothetical protein
MKVYYSFWSIVDWLLKIWCTDKTIISFIYTLKYFCVLLFLLLPACCFMIRNLFYPVVNLGKRKRERKNWRKIIKNNFFLHNHKIKQNVMERMRDLYLQIWKWVKRESEKEIIWQVYVLFRLFLIAVATNNIRSI